MSKLDELKKLVASLEEDAQKFYGKSNHAAGTRLRVGLQEVKKAAQELREEVTLLKSQS